LYPNGDLFDSFFSNSRNKLGNVAEDLSLILERRKSVIKNNFCYFTDDNCKKCEVIGYCWGGCVNNIEIVKNNPSNYCDQKKIISNLKYLVENDDLIIVEKNYAKHKNQEFLQERC
jgi:radical SAM protein with 4Fe4S-binding SPASM domain